MLETNPSTGPVTRAISAMRDAAALTTQDLSTAEGEETRVMDLRLAEALGFERPRKIRELIERHREALERFGEVRPTAGQTSEKGGRPGIVYWLNKKQALYLCTKSETALATEVTIEVVEVFDAVTSGAGADIVGLDRNGLALFRIGGRLVLADTTRWQLVDERAVVLTHEGRFKVERVTYDQAERHPWLGKRFGYGPWKKAKPGRPMSGGRDGHRIIGAVVDIVLARSTRGAALAAR